MIILDFRDYGKKLTLEDCAELYDSVVQTMTPMPYKIGYKGKVVVIPDQVWATAEQRRTLLVTAYPGGNKPWDYWRGIPIVTKEKVVVG